MALSLSRRRKKNTCGCWSCMNCLGKAAHKGSTLYFFCVSVLLQGSCNAARNAIFFTYVSLVIKGLQQSCEQKIFRYDLGLWNLGNFRAFWNDVVGCSATKYAWHLRCMHSFEHSQLWKPSKLSDFWAKRDPSRKRVSGRSMKQLEDMEIKGGSGRVLEGCIMCIPFQ